MLRAASIGLGWWSDELAKSINAQSDKIEIVSCFSRNKKKCLEFARKFGTKTHVSYESVLADAEVDAVILTTPHSLHAEHVIQAANAKKHIFVEKPFALTLASALEAAIACESAGIVLAVGHNRRFSAAVTQIEQLISTGQFGTILHLEANFSAPGAMSYTSDRWRASRIESPAGGIAALGIHMIDLLCYFGGDIVRVHAQAKRLAVPVDIDDTTSVLFQFSSGASGYLGCMFACPYTSYLNIYGTKANVFAEIDAQKMRIQHLGKPSVPIKLQSIDTLRTELEEFADSCTGGTPFRVTPKQATSNVAIMEAITDSAEKGLAVDIDHDFQSAW